MISMKSQKGFTLIELLIVIVIIGILAGVLIAIIDPQAQQNRARDANLQSTLNKLALGVLSYKAAYGVLPNGAQIVDAAKGLACTGSGCATATSYTFSVTNAQLPNATLNNGTLLAGYGCSGTAGSRYYGFGSTGDCDAMYFALDTSGNDFYIFAKSFGLFNGVFRYSSVDSRIYKCVLTTSAAPTNNCGTAI